MAERKPTPRIKGNLPSMDESKSDTEGRELKPPPMEWYERGQGTPQGTVTYRHGDFGPYPEPPEGVSAGRGLTEADIAQLRRDDPGARYNKGGPVKHGSSTCIVCDDKFKRR